jgi:hypothetical protein
MKCLCPFVHWDVSSNPIWGMNVCVSLFCVCVQVVALRRADPPSEESYRLYKRLRNWKTVKIQQKAVQPYIDSILYLLCSDLQMYGKFTFYFYVQIHEFNILYTGEPFTSASLSPQVGPVIESDSDEYTTYWFPPGHNPKTNRLLLRVLKYN